MLLIFVIDDRALLSVVYDGASVDQSHSNYSHVTSTRSSQTLAKVKAEASFHHSICHRAERTVVVQLEASTVSFLSMLLICWW